MAIVTAKPLECAECARLRERADALRSVLRAIERVGFPDRIAVPPPADPTKDATEDRNWRAMVYAPLDGTEVELLIRHQTWWTARKCGESGEQWQGPCRGKWLDFNGGGWSWSGHMGTPIGWRPLMPQPEAATR